MKIAYLITAYNNPNHLNKLIDAIKTDSTEIFVHIDEKSAVKVIPNANAIFLKKRYRVYWGGYSMVQAILELIQFAINKNHFEYFYLLSGSDYPIKSNKSINTFFEQNHGKEFINICKMPENGKDFYRTDYYRIEADFNKELRNRFSNYINDFIRLINLKRKFPKQYRDYILYGGSTWWALSFAAIKYILNFVQENPIFEKFYKNVFIPEELFFQTVLGNSAFMPSIKNSPTIAIWPAKASAHPIELTKDNINLLKQNTVSSTYGNGSTIPIFARKFSDNSSDLISYIESEIRNRS